MRAFACVPILIAMTFAGSMTFADVFRSEAQVGKHKIIQQMYWINRNTCVADAVPLQPKVLKGPKLGTLKFHNEPSATKQCPDTKANSIFVLYTATKPGKERITIVWKPTTGRSFKRTYQIDVK